MYAIKATVDGKEAYLRGASGGHMSFRALKGELTRYRGRYKGGEIYTKIDATRMDKASVERAFGVLEKHPNLFPDVFNPEIISID